MVGGPSAPGTAVPAGPLDPGTRTQAAPPPERAHPRHQRLPRPTRRWVLFGAAGGAYLLLSFGLWWHVWTSHPTATATCGCGDPALFLWFLEWPAYAISHGHSPLYSAALFHPRGINLLANTSVLAIGIPLAPLTWLFGPVATFNVAATMGPALSALAMFWLARRWAPWWPAAFLAGLLFGFSPFLLGEDIYGHLMTANLALVPLIVGCLDELLIRQRRSPLRVGALLGLLVTVQFFVSSEVLMVLALTGGLGAVLLVGYSAFGHREELLERVPVALRGLGAAAGVALVLLAYPAWFALAGPAHLPGRIWNNSLTAGYVPQSFFDTNFHRHFTLFDVLGGYFGTPLISTAFVGWGFVIVVVGGILVWRRDRRLWFFGLMALASAALALRHERSVWTPAALLARVPIVQNVLPTRFLVVLYLSLAVLLAVIVQRSRDAVRRHLTSGRRSSPARLLAAGTAGIAVAALALGPIVAGVLPTVPFTVQAVVLPRWFALDAPRLAPKQVLLVVPPPFSGIQSAMAWQAVNRMHYAMAGGGGPEGVPGRAGPERPGFVLLSSLGFGVTPPPQGSPRQFSAISRALSGWGVTRVVVPSQPGLPGFVRGRDPEYATGFLTAVIGRVPTYTDQAWIWTDVERSTGPLRVPAGTVPVCTKRYAGRPHAPDAVPRCVESAAA